VGEKKQCRGGKKKEKRSHHLQKETTNKPANHENSTEQYETLLITTKRRHRVKGSVIIKAREGKGQEKKKSQADSQVKGKGKSQISRQSTGVKGEARRGGGVGVVGGGGWGGGVPTKKKNKKIRKSPFYLYILSKGGAREGEGGQHRVATTEQDTKKSINLISRLLCPPKTRSKKA